MPITRSEALYFGAGVVAGAMAKAALPALREKYGPLVATAVAGARSAFADAVADAAGSARPQDAATPDRSTETRTTVYVRAAEAGPSAA